MLRKTPSRRLSLALLTLLAGGAAASGPPPAPSEALAAVRSDLALDAGALSGPGAGVLSGAAAGVRFVLVGEDHGIAEIPAFAAALHRALAPAGFDTLALEIGPAAAAELEGILAGPDRHARLAEWLKRHPFALAFYDLAEEAAFLERAADTAGGRLRLVGFDQELMGAGRLLLERARAATARPETRALLDGLLEAETAAFARAAGSGNPTELFLMSADPADLERARAALALESAAAAAPLEALLASRHVYELNATEGWRSNIERAALMRRNLHAALPGELPKLLVKVGAYHAYKGVNPMRSRELGNHLAELAEAAGERSLHLLVIAGAGEQAQFAGVGRPPASVPITVAGDDGIPALAPLVEIAAQHPAWSLFDLRPLRPRYHALTVADPELDRLVQGFDLVLVIPKGTASRPLG